MMEDKQHDERGDSFVPKTEKFGGPAGGVIFSLTTKFEQWPHPDSYITMSLFNGRTSTFNADRLEAMEDLCGIMRSWLRQVEDHLSGTFLPTNLQLPMPVINKDLVRKTAPK